MRKLTLEDIAEILPGYPFRGALRAQADGNAWAVQVRHVSSQEWLSIASDGQPEETPGVKLDRVMLGGRRQPDYLRSSDVLFLARGSSNTAVLIEKIPEGTVCTPHFFLIRIRSEFRNCVAPGFLAWQLNHGEGRAAITAGRQGSLQPSVRKPELARVQLTLPPLQRQHSLVALYRACEREASYMHALVHNRRREVNAVGQALLRADQTR